MSDSIGHSGQLRPSSDGRSFGKQFIIPRAAHYEPSYLKQRLPRADTQNRIRRLEVDLTSKTTEMETLKGQYAESEQEIGRLRAKLRAQAEEFDKLEETSQQQRNLIKTLEVSEKNLNNTINQLGTGMSSVQRPNSELVEDMTARFSNVMSLFRESYLFSLNADLDIMAEKFEEFKKASNDTVDTAVYYATQRFREQFDGDEENEGYAQQDYSPTEHENREGDRPDRADDQEAFDSDNDDTEVDKRESSYFGLGSTSKDNPLTTAVDPNGDDLAVDKREYSHFRLGSTPRGNPFTTGTPPPPPKLTDPIRSGMAHALPARPPLSMKQHTPPIGRPLSGGELSPKRTSSASKVDEYPKLPLGKPFDVPRECTPPGPPMRVTQVQRSYILPRKESERPKPKISTIGRTFGKRAPGGANEKDGAAKAKDGGASAELAINVRESPVKAKSPSINPQLEVSHRRWRKMYFS